MSHVGGGIRRGIESNPTDKVVISGDVKDKAKWEELKEELRRLLAKYGVEMLPRKKNP